MYLPIYKDESSFPDSLKIVVGKDACNTLVFDKNNDPVGNVTDFTVSLSLKTDLISEATFAFYNKEQDDLEYISYELPISIVAFSEENS